MIDFILIHFAPLIVPLLAMPWYPCCTICPCCDSGSDSKTMQVEFTGVADNSNCTECDSFNATFELPLDNTIPLDSCTWELEAPEGEAVFPCDMKSDSGDGTSYITKMDFVLNCVDDCTNSSVHQLFTVWSTGGLGDVEAHWALRSEGVATVDCNSVSLDSTNLGASAHKFCDWTMASIAISKL